MKKITFLAAGLAAMTGLMTADVASAQEGQPQQSQAQKDKKKKKAKITVTVPSTGTAVTYTAGGKSFTVQPGQSVTLPPNAANLVLPANTIITSSSTKPNGVSTTASFSVSSTVNLANTGSGAIKAESSKLQVATVASTNKLGETTTINVAEGTAVTTNAAGQTVTTFANVEVANEVSQILNNTVQAVQNSVSAQGVTSSTNSDLN